MKKAIWFIALFLLPLIIYLYSCNKEFSCENCLAKNQAPTARAGNDTIIILPADSAILSGTLSSDPDDGIEKFHWAKTGGPDKFNISDANAIATIMTGLEEGTYQFELRITDTGGLSSRDTLKIIVRPAFTYNCDVSSRPLLYAKLIPAGNVSQTRNQMAVATAGSKILYAGGYTDAQFTPSSRVDIFDVSSNTWTTAELSEARFDIATAVLGNRIFLAGGSKAGGMSSRVDIYNAVTNTWEKTELSSPRSGIAAAAVNNKILFAGGYGINSPAPPVDIYDELTNKWTTDSLRKRPTTGIIGDAGISATVIGTNVYFAGNASDWLGWDFGSISSIINIYHAGTNTWSTGELSIPRGFMAGIAVGNKNYWAGGVYNQNEKFTDLVEIRDMSAGVSEFACLFQPNGLLNAVQKNNRIIFFTSDQKWPATIIKNKFDVYDINSNTWSIGVLPETINGASIISVNNAVYIAGGWLNGNVTSKVWKLEF